MAGRNGPKPALNDKCYACDAPGGCNKSMLETHYFGKDKSVFLCPLCYSALHLDEAGIENSGVVIWLPEISQEQLNLICLAIFISLKKSSRLGGDEESKKMVEHMVWLYKKFEKRSEPIHTLLASESKSNSKQFQAAGSTAYIANLFVKTMRDKNMSSREIAEKTKGLKLLPNPEKFKAYIDELSLLSEKEFPVETWMKLVKQHESDKPGSPIDGAKDSGSESFDATPDAPVETSGEEPAWVA